MPLNIYPNIYAPGSVPGDCQPSRGGTIKYPVLNHACPAVLRELRRLRAGRWQKVIRCGNIGEAHYFEHRSGRVAGVKFYSRPVTQ